MKVVQRVPVRLALDGDRGDVAAGKLRAGLSVIVDIDTGKARGISGLVPTASAAE